ncbi:MAG: UDP-N-acetylglucosamine 2-epimerase (non-hydrolyzing) [Candidatus Omnitrophota bacterium]
MKQAKLAFIFGTRPEIIKLSPVIRLCIKKKVPFFTVHTGQHYSRNMSDVFLKELALPAPDYSLNIRSKAPYRQGDHTGRMMAKMEDILLKEMPSVVLVHGDTNSALAGALTASKISTTKAFTGFDMKVAHVEAGLRSYDRTMPEEINRVIVDHLSDHLFAPTKRAKDIMISEGIDPKKIYVTGNTIVDAVYYELRSEKRLKSISKKFKLEKDAYMLLTLHRQENVDDKNRMKEIFRGIDGIHNKYGLPIVFPIHPRTVKKMEGSKIKLKDHIRIIKPSGFTEFICMERNARLVLSDSGGVQEETCVLKTPCVTLRDSTERPETVEVGSNVVAGVSAVKIIKASDLMMSKHRNWKNPFGNGDAAEKILIALKK